MNIMVIGSAGFVLIVLFTVLLKMKTKKKKERAMELQAEDKLREAALDKIILNDKGQGNESNIFSAKPFEVNYDPESVGKQIAKTRKTNHKTMFQIIEKSELSSRKYMFDPSKGIRIGGKKGKNDIIVADTDINDEQCEIVLSNSTVYVRNLGESRKVILKRGRQQAYIERKYVELKSEDVICLGKTFFKIEIIKTNAK